MDLATRHVEMRAMWPPIALATAGVTVGTVLGSHALRWTWSYGSAACGR